MLYRDAGHRPCDAFQGANFRKHNCPGRPYIGGLNVHDDVIGSGHCMCRPDPFDLL